MKWRNWKLMFKELDSIEGGHDVKRFSVPALYNLHLDPREEQPMLNAPPNLWVRYPASEALLKHASSLQKEPPIKPGTPDPYQPIKE